MVLRRLFIPLDYIRIKHPEKKIYDSVIPLTLSASTVFLFITLPLPMKIFGQNGLVSYITGFLQTLIGFYIASLAAVATFNRDGMDDLMKGKTPTLKVKDKGQKIVQKLTRRRFLCLLFGYLSFIGIFLYFFGVFSELFADNIKLILPVSLHPYSKLTFIFIFMTITYNLLVTTLFGLFYLVDRIHRN